MKLTLQWGSTAYPMEGITEDRTQKQMSVTYNLIPDARSSRWPTFNHAV